MPKLAIKVDIDTYLGTKKGILPLIEIFEKYSIEATFLFSLGYDYTGRSISRIFKKGFLKKCLKTNVAGNYSKRTLLYGTLLPAPLIYKKSKNEILEVSKRGFECGIHSWNHYKWQNSLYKMDLEEVRGEFLKARESFSEILGFEAKTCGAAGWQISPGALTVQDEAKLDYCSDTRIGEPFIPIMGAKSFNTLQIPTTLPTLDEILIDTKDLSKVRDFYVGEILNNEVSVMTIHSELEALRFRDYFEDFIRLAKSRDIEFLSLRDYAKDLNSKRDKLAKKEIKMLEFKNRSGLIAQSV